MYINKYIKTQVIKNTKGKYRKEKLLSDVEIGEIVEAGRAEDNVEALNEG